MPRKRPAKTAAEPTPEDENTIDLGVVLTGQALEPDPTVGEFLGLPPLPTPEPGFAAMADDIDALGDPTAPTQHQVPDLQQVEDDYRPGDIEPPPGERPPENSDEVTAALNKQRQAVYDTQRRRAGFAPKIEKTNPPVIDHDFIPPGNVRYESRIQIVDAFKYQGTLAGAPTWIDRNWVGFGDYDPVRHIDEGPCLRVPSSANPDEVVLCRVGDYVCRQSVLLDNGRMPELRTEVWASDQFERLFVGTVLAKNPVKGISGPGSALGDMGRRRKPAA